MLDLIHLKFNFLRRMRSYIAQESQYLEMHRHAFASLVSVQLAVFYALCTDLVQTKYVVALIEKCMHMHCRAATENWHQPKYIQYYLHLPFFYLEGCSSLILHIYVYNVVLWVYMYTKSSILTANVFNVCQCVSSVQ